MQIFEYVVVFNGVKKADGTYDEAPKILSEGRVLEESGEILKMKLTRELPKEFESKLKTISIMIRDFHAQNRNSIYGSTGGVLFNTASVAYNN